MATGQFTLYYRDGTTDVACADVHYQVHSPGGAILASGTTDGQGRTKVFASSTGAGTYRLLVRATDRGGWEAPHLAEGADNTASLELGDLADKSSALKKVRVKPYFRVRFHTHPERKPLANAKFTAYALDANGKEAIAQTLDTAKPVQGSTNAQGETGMVFCANRVVFKFEVPRTTVKVSSARLNPLVKGRGPDLYEVAFKTVRAITAPDANHQVPLAGKTSVPVLISPADQELLMVPQSDFDEFEEVSGQLEKILQASHLAKLDLSRALESQNQAAIEEAEKALGLAQDKVKSELNKRFSTAADLKECYTLESYAKGRDSATGASQMGLRRRQLSEDNYLKFKSKRLNKSEYKINIKFSGPAGVSADATAAPKSLDAKALRESFNKIATTVKSKKEWNGDPQVLYAIEMAGNQFADTLLKSESYEVDAQAQWFRLVGAAGASAELDWTKKKVQLQGNLQAKAMLCEGKVTGTWAVPSLKGWMMSLAGEDMGALRFVVECSLYGFAGAKIMATGTVGITLEGGKQVAKAINPGKGDRIAGTLDTKTRLPKFEAAGLYESAPKDMNGASLGIDVFAGAEGGITLGGKVQWLPPKEKDFVSFAEISGDVAGSVGAGFKGQFEVYLRGGKFRIKAAARLCWGVGAKGAAEFTVQADKLGEFVRWVFYQLLHAGFKQLVYFNRQAFEALSQLVVMSLADGSEPEKMWIEWAHGINDAFEVALKSLEQAEKRNALVNNINRNPHWLVHATPETRGMLLYQITRHGLASHSRDLPSASESSLTDVQVHYMPTHKQAICNIMAGIQTASGWDNVMQHMTARGTKSALPSGTNEGDVVRFLNNGISLAELPSVFRAMNAPRTQGKDVKPDPTGNTFLDKYLTMRGKCLHQFPLGYQVARMDTPQFEGLRPFDGDQAVWFAQLETRGLGEAMAGDPGSSLA